MNDPKFERAAEAFVSELWRNLSQRITAALSGHHREHEPFGNDEIHLPLAYLPDVEFGGTEPTDGSVLTYNASSRKWRSGSGGGYNLTLGEIVPAIRLFDTVTSLIFPDPRIISVAPGNAVAGDPKTVYLGSGLKIQNLATLPTVIVENVRGFVFPGATFTKDEDNVVTVTVGGSSDVQIVGGMFGDLVTGSQTVAITNLKGKAIPYNRLKATCEPEAPAGGLSVSVLGHGLTIGAGGKDSGLTQLGAAGSWAPDTDIIATLTVPGGVYTGTVLVMVAYAPPVGGG
jgi:hypothetical protein